MSIEFGIPARGSTISLQGAFRIDVDEPVFLELQSVLVPAAHAAWQELDLYGSAAFEGAGLQSLIATVSAWQPGNSASTEATAFMAELLRVAKHAEASEQPVLYLGV